MSVKKEIASYMDELERHPETSFEVDLMCEDEEAFCLSNDNIGALRSLLSQVICHLCFCISVFIRGYD